MCANVFTKGLFEIDCRKHFLLIRHTSSLWHTESKRIGQNSEGQRRCFMHRVTLSNNIHIQAFKPLPATFQLEVRQWPVVNQGRGRFLPVDEIIFSWQHCREIIFSNYDLNFIWCFRRAMIFFSWKAERYFFFSRKPLPAPRLSTGRCLSKNITAVPPV